jgi:hypothetical protein
MEYYRWNTQAPGFLCRPSAGCPWQSAGRPGRPMSTAPEVLEALHQSSGAREEAKEDCSENFQNNYFFSGYEGLMISANCTFIYFGQGFLIFYTWAMARVCISATALSLLTHSWRSLASMACNLKISPDAGFRVKVLESSSLGQITAEAKCTDPRGRCFRCGCCCGSVWNKNMQVLSLFSDLFPFFTVVIMRNWPFF